MNCDVDGQIDLNVLHCRRRGGPGRPLDPDPGRGVQDQPRLRPPPPLQRVLPLRNRDMADALAYFNIFLNSSSNRFKYFPSIDL